MHAIGLLLIWICTCMCPRLLNHCNSERTTILILHFSCCLSRLSNLNLIKDEFFTILIYLNETNTSVFVCVLLDAFLIPQLFVNVFHTGILWVTTWGRRAWVTATAAACCCSHISSGPSWLFCRHASLPPELEKKVLQNIYFCYSRWCMRVRDTQAINLLPSYSVCKGPILLPMIHEDERMVIRVRRQYYWLAKLLRLIWQRRSLVSVSFMCIF